MAWFQFAIPGIIDDEISGANARLIAAAPDLLAVCEFIVAPDHPIGSDAEHISKLRAKARVILAKLKA